MTGITIIPASGETTIIDEVGDNIAQVVAWQHIQGAMLFPMFAMNRPGVRNNEAIWHQDGTVTHPASQTLFPDVDTWTNWAKENGPLDKGTEEPAAAANASSKPAGGKTTAPNPVPITARPADTTSSFGPIKFGTKTYSTKSYWTWPNMKVLFEIEGGVPYPDDPRVEKIKRDEFAQLKRDGFDKIDPSSGVLNGDLAAAGEAAEAVEEDEEDMDVV